MLTDVSAKHLLQEKIKHLVEEGQRRLDALIALESQVAEVRPCIFGCAKLHVTFLRRSNISITGALGSLCKIGARGRGLECGRGGGR